MTDKLLRERVLNEAADYIAKQKEAYPESVFRHLSNFREVQCFDCCAAAMALHTMSWLEAAIRKLTE